MDGKDRFTRLQELLEWISLADENQIDGLYDVIFNKKIQYIDDVVGKDFYKKFIKDIEEEVIQNIKCSKCDADIVGGIFCEDCLKD